MFKNTDKLVAFNKRRNPAEDRLKAESPMQICRVSNCNNHISEYQGPGSQTVCREHQLIMREYGGNARLDRMWTFFKGDVCVVCGHNPMKNIRLQELPYDEKRVYSRMMLHVDHINADKNDNTAKNLQTLCLDCHVVKTLKDGDFLKKTK